MSDYFYYFGFLYIVDLLRALWKLRKQEPIEPENVINIEDGMGVTELINMREKIQSKIDPKKTIPRILFGFMFFIWAAVGYTSNTPEKAWFLFDVMVIIVCWLFLFSIGIMISLRAIYGSKAKIHNEEKKPSVSIPLGHIQSLTELLIVSFILYHHFFVK